MQNKIRQYKEQQLKYQTLIEKNMVGVWKERFLQSKNLHTVEKKKTKISQEVVKQFDYQLSEAKIKTDISKISLGKAQDKNLFEFQDRKQKQLTYRTKLEIGQIEIADLISERIHKFTITGGSSIGEFKNTIGSQDLPRLINSD